MSRVTETKIPCCFASETSSVSVFWAEGEGHLTIETKEFAVQTGACLDREKARLMRDQLNSWLGDGEHEACSLQQAIKNAAKVAHLFSSGGGLLAWIEAEAASLEAADAGVEKCE